MQKHYTYSHQTADTGKIFYIGKGIKYRYKEKKGRNSYWQNIVAKHGFTAEILSYWNTEQEALDHEILLIKCFRDMGYNLANLSSGGEKTNLGCVQPLKSNIQRSLKMKAILSDPLKKRVNADNLKAMRNNKEVQKRRIAKVIAYRKSTGKKVLCKETNEIFCSTKAAELWLISIGKLKASQSAICMCCNGRRNIAYGYHWEYV